MEDREGILMIRPHELKRYQLIAKIFDKHINQQEAAEQLGLSDRQVRRIVKRVRIEGEQGVIHRLRGIKGTRRIPDTIRSRVLDLYRERYSGFGPTLASEKLLELDHVRVSDETLRLWLAAAGLWHVDKLRSPKKRTWRARKDKFGQMVQMDGSHHDWLEGRGPKLVLMGYIDDATGRIYGEFFDFEGTIPAMGSLKGYIERNGLPSQIYLDKHATYKNNRKYQYTDWPFRDEEELTQFARACRQLGIELIYAHSPQAKGRIERLFKTLQDRLVKEMRLAGIKTCKEANEFLGTYIGKFNARFAVPALKKGNAHRRLDERVILDEILSVQTEHVLRNDRTVVHERKFYQVKNRTRAQRVTVFEYINGRMAIKYGQTRLDFSLITERPHIPPKIDPQIKKVKASSRWSRYAPPRNAPWRIGFRLKGSPCFRN